MWGIRIGSLEGSHSFSSFKSCRCLCMLMMSRTCIFSLLSVPQVSVLPCGGICAHVYMSVTGNRWGRWLLEMGIAWKFPTLNSASYLFPTLVCQRSPKFSRRRRSWWHTASVSPFPWWKCTCSSSKIHVSPLLNPSMHPRVYQSPCSSFIYTSFQPLKSSTIGFKSPKYLLVQGWKEVWSMIWVWPLEDMEQQCFMCSLVSRCGRHTVLWSTELGRAGLSAIQESRVTVRGRGTKEMVSRKQFRILFAFTSWSLV